MKRLSINGLRRQAGVTILEFIAFIGLAALVIAGALGLYTTANTGSQANDLFQSVNGIATATRQVAAGSTPSATTRDNVPAPKGWTKANNRYNKDGSNGINIGLATTQNGFTISLNCTDASADACQQIGTKSIGNTSGVPGTSNNIIWSNVPY